MTSHLLAYSSKIGPTILLVAIHAGHWKSANMTRVCFHEPYVGEGIIDCEEAVEFVEPDEDVFEMVELHAEIIKKERKTQIYRDIRRVSKK